MMKSYETAMAEVTRPRCAICEHPSRDEIEADRAAGRTYSVIARVLTRIGDFGTDVSPRTAARRVAIHFQEHVR
jgi:hypothetical protein